MCKVCVVPGRNESTENHPQALLLPSSYFCCLSVQQAAVFSEKHLLKLGIHPAQRETETLLQPYGVHIQ